GVVPLEYATSGVRVCQLNKDDVELLGLIKFDILGLRTLSIVDEAVRMVRQSRGIALNIDNLSLDDPAVYDVICSSKTIGIFQVAHDFAGLSYADSDGLRRAISHYRTEMQMSACREEFVESAVRLGRARDLAEQIYEMIAYFSGYGFCRSHAAAFAKTVYQTAFIKVYYPAEFLAAILSNEPCCYYPTQTIIEEARKWGIRVLPVDINRSNARYNVEYGAIRMGLMQVKGLTEATAEEIVRARGN